VSDTPRTDEQINGKPCTQFEILAGDSLRDALVPSEFSRKLERELNAATSEIARLTSKVAQLYEGAEEQNQRIKRLEDWIAALDPIAQHSGQSNLREWHGVDTGWLYPSHVVYLGDAKP